MVITSQRSGVVLEWNQRLLSASHRRFRHPIELNNDCGPWLDEANGTSFFW
jgi:hypothetical protein